MSIDGGAPDENSIARKRWEWPADEIRRVGYKVVDLIAEHLTRLPDSPVFTPFPADLASRYQGSSMPESGATSDDILDRFSSEIEPYPFGNGHPAFYGWVNSPPTPIGIFADALAAAMNPSCAGGNHAAIYVERAVLNWFRQIMRFPAGSTGLLVSGGSAAALTALTVARHTKCGFNVRTTGLKSARSQLIVYQSGEAHGCHQKAIELLGIGSESLRRIEHNGSLQMVPAALDTRLRQDIDRGDTPIAVIANAGAVNTGAIDPLDEIADVCRDHNVWMHVDGAYGAPAILSSNYSSRLSGLSRADSLAVDPHKWFYVPVEAGLVLVRDAEAMRAAFSLVPPYLRTDGNAEGVGGPPWFSEYGFQQTRGFRALKIWMSLMYHGLEGYRAAIERDIYMAEMLADQVRKSSDFQLLDPQSLSIVCFRYHPRSLPGRQGEAETTARVSAESLKVSPEAYTGGAEPESKPNLEELNRINKAVVEKLQISGRAFLSLTTIGGIVWMRACVVNPRARETDILGLLDVLREIAMNVRGATG